MLTVNEPRKKRVFLASSWLDLAPVRRMMHKCNLDAVTLEESATPGTSWVDSLYRCVNDSDLVLGIMGDRRQDTNIFFELGVASALNKPTLLFVASDYPVDLIPPSGIPYLRMDIHNEDAVLFGLKQVVALSPRDRTQSRTNGYVSKPLGPLADAFLARLPQVDDHGFEVLILDVIRAIGITTIAWEDNDGDGVDFAVWSNDLEPTIANPLLIDCRLNLDDHRRVNELIGRMFRSLGAIRNGCGFVFYRDLGPNLSAVPAAFPVIFVAASALIEGVREIAFAEFVRTIRNAALQGS